MIFPKPNRQQKFDELIFENRNKQYGAYVLRTESDRILTKSLFVGISLLAAFSLTPVIISVLKPVKITETITKDDYNIYTPIDINPETEEFPRVEQQIIPQVQATKEFDNTVPTPTRNANEDNIVKDIPKDATPGLTNNFTAPPADNTSYTPPSSSLGNTTVAPPKVVPTVDKIPDNTINTIVDVEAKFEGGEAEFRKKIANSFDGSQFESEGVLKTTLTFVVERDGSISNIKADGKDASFNAEALRTIKSIKGKWTPAKVKGESVRSYFKFPISMKFE